MAFNPFSWFRDNQKGVMIGLIGLCMVIFIFQFGQGDAFTRLLNYMGAGRASGEVVATLYGKKVREGDVGQTANRRKLASAFLYDTVQKGQREVAKDLTLQIQEQSKASSDLKESPKFAGLQLTLMMYGRINEMVSRPDPRMQPQQLQQTVTSYVQQMGSTLRNLESSAAKPDLAAEDRFVYQQVATLLGFQRMTLTRSRDDYYFGGGSKTEDALDFRLWQLQADRLGIKLTDADVMKEIVAEAAGSKVLDPTKSFADQAPVMAYLRSFGRDKNNAVTPSDLMDALREEFRVVMAQGALLGVEPGVRAYRSELTTSATPSLATPDEFLDFYREQRTALRVKLFPISADSYLSQIKDEPTEAELRARFDRGVKIEQMPFGREAGFKQPRRIKLEYAFASAEDPHYKKVAGEQVAVLRKLGDPNGRLSSAVASILSPGLAGLPLAFDPLGRDFDDALVQDGAWFGAYDKLDAMEKKVGAIHDTSALAPASVASLFAGSFGGPSVSGLVATRSLWYFEEVRRSLPFNLGMMASQSDPQTLFGAAALAAQTMPPATPRALLEPQILAAKEKSLAEIALRSNIDTMAVELRKLAKKPAEARAYIAKAVQEYKLSIRAMPAVRSPQDLLEELKDKKNALELDPLRKGILSDPNKPWTPGENTMQQSREFVGYILQGNGTYQPIPVDRIVETKQDFLFWRTEDYKAEERTFSQVRADVVAAWKLDKARTLARNQAEKLEAEVNKMKATPADAERFLKEQKLTSFELDKVVQATPPEREVHFGMTTQYRPYQVPEDKADLLPYPPQDLAKQLMKLARPGDATVVVDSPAKTFYVALLVDRAEPSLSDFKSVYVRSPNSDPMYMALMGRRREEYRKSVMEQLRRDAGADLDKEGRFKLPEAVRKAEPGQFEES
jgi:hypothetical protein